MAWRLGADHALLVVGSPAGSGAPGARPGGAAGAARCQRWGAPGRLQGAGSAALSHALPASPARTWGGRGTAAGRGGCCLFVQPCAPVPRCALCGVCLSVCVRTHLLQLPVRVQVRCVPVCCLCVPVPLFPSAQHLVSPGPLPRRPLPPEARPRIHSAPLLHSSLPEPKLAQLSTAGEAFGSKLGAGWARGVLGAGVSSGTGYQGVDQPQAPPSASRTAPPPRGVVKPGRRTPIGMSHLPCPRFWNQQCTFLVVVGSGWGASGGGREASGCVGLCPGLPG